MIFKKNKIINEDEAIGEKLRAAREEKKIDIIQAAKKTKISKTYLLALENNDFRSLPSGVYAKTFLREYADFLGLKHEPLLNRYSQEIENRPDAENNVFSKRKINKIELVIFSKILKNILIFLVITVFFAYLGYYLLNTFSLPDMEVYQPADNLLTQNNYIDVTGRADSKTQITINDQQVLKNEQGNFSERINLKKGMNTIVISGQNKYSRKKIIEKQILVK
jgi:transcriptional regulator with XRE-family HTH domain